MEVECKSEPSARCSGERGPQDPAFIPRGGTWTKIVVKEVGLIKRRPIRGNILNSNGKDEMLDTDKGGW